MYDYMETAKKAAHEFYRYEFYRSNIRIEYGELLGEAYVAMTEAFTTWDEDKGRSLNSWVAFIVKQRLSNKFYSTISNIDFAEIEETTLLQSTDPNCMNPELLCIIGETISAFSETSREIIRAIFDEEIKPVTYNKNAVTREIKNYLRSKGFPWWKIRAAFKELRQYANSLA